MQLQEAADALAHELRQKVHFRALPADRVREYLSRVVGQWATELGWTPVREAVAEHLDDGAFDFLCHRPGQPWLAIEIDRGSRKRSLDKLSRAAAEGHLAIWLRWAGRPPADIPAGVALIHLPVTRDTSTDHRRAYMLTWR